MTKQRWKGSLNSFSNHIDPRKEEQMKWLKIGKQPETLQFHRQIWDIALKPHRMQFKACLLAPERGFLWYTEWQLISKIEDQVKNILKIMKNINHGNKERNLRKKSEAIQLIEDFHKQYESLYSLYVDLREEVKKKAGGEDDDKSSSSSDSDSESHDRNNKVSSGTSDSDNQKSENSDLEDTILKDKLTCSSEVKKTMNPEPESAFSSPQKSELVFKDLGIQGEQPESTSQIFDRIKDLEEQVNVLKREVSTLYVEKRQLEEQVECSSHEAMQMKERITRLEAQILEMEATSKEKEREFNTLSKQGVDNEQHHSPRSSDLDEIQLELNTLKHQKGELQERLSDETEKWSSKVISLQQELENVNSQKDELKQKLEKKSKEKTECLLQIEALRHDLSLNEQQSAKEKESLKVKVSDLELEIEMSRSQKSELEEQIKKMNEEAFQSSVEKENLQAKIVELQKALSERENELSIEQMKLKDCQTITSVQIKSLAEGVEHLKNKLESMQDEKKCLQVDLEELRNSKELLQMELDKEKENSSQLEKSLKTNFHLVERKVEELAEEFRKRYDDHFRILSRRIRVAEQLQVEGKEWYRKTRETYEQEIKELKEMAERTEIELKHVQDLTLTANELLTSLDSQALKFEERAGYLVNRISKASCELNFAKQLAARKNKGILQVKDDFDCSLVQLDDKEAEILVLREKTWKSENRVRELEKMIKEREDETLVLNEEKREAIRQLCVWIDYHRSRSDFYKKILSEMNTGRRRES